MDHDDRVFFQVTGLDTTYKLKLAPRSTFRHLFQHLPLHRGPYPAEDAVVMWHDTIIDAQLTPNDYGMAAGERHAHILRVNFLRPASATSSSVSQPASSRSASADSTTDDGLRPAPAVAASSGRHPHAGAYYARRSSANAAPLTDDEDAAPVRSLKPAAAVAAQPAGARMQVPSYPSSAASDVEPSVPSAAAARTYFASAGGLTATPGATARSQVQQEQQQGASAQVVFHAFSAATPSAAAPARRSSKSVVDNAYNGASQQAVTPATPVQRSLNTTAASARAIVSPTPLRDEDDYDGNHDHRHGVGAPAAGKEHPAPTPQSNYLRSSAAVAATTPAAQRLERVVDNDPPPPPPPPQPTTGASSRRDSIASTTVMGSSSATPALQPGLQQELHHTLSSSTLGGFTTASSRAPTSSNVHQHQQVYSSVGVEEAARIADLETSLALKQRMVEDLTAQLQQARSEAMASATAQHHHQAQLANAASSNAELERLRLQLEHQRQANDRLRTQLRDAEMEHVEALQAATATADSRITNEISELRRKVAALDSVVGQRDAAERRAQAAEAALESMRRDSDGLRRFSENQSAEFTAVAAELSHLKSEYAADMAEMRHQIESLNSQNDALLNESAVASQNAIRAQSQYKTLSDKAAADAAAASKVPGLEAALAAKEAELSNRAADVAKWQRTATELNATVQSLRNDVVGGNETINRLQREGDALRRDLRDAERAADEANAAAVRDRRRAVDDTDRVRSTVAELEASVVECNRVIIDIQQENTRLRRSIIELQQELIEAQQQLQQQPQPQPQPTTAASGQGYHPNAVYGFQRGASPPSTMSAPHMPSAPATVSSSVPPPPPQAVHHPPRSGSVSSATAKDFTVIPNATVPPLSHRPTRARLPGQPHPAPSQMLGPQQQQQHH